MKALDKNFKLHKKYKRILASLETKEERRIWKDAYISAEQNDNPKLTMNYDVSPSGKIPRRVTEKQNENA
jgi:hypothetical protein